MTIYSRFTPQPLPDYVGPALGNLVQSVRSSEEQAKQKQDADEQQRNAAIYQQYMRLQPDQQAKVYSTLPDSLKSLAFNPAAIPSHTPTDLERSQNDEALAKARFGAKTATDSSSTFDTLPRSVRQEGTYQSAYGAAMPSESVKLANAQDVTGNKSSWSPEVQQRQSIEDKRALDAQQAATIPSENALRGAQASNQRSEIPLHQAQTTKAQEETRGLKTTNDMMGGIAGGIAGGALPQGVGARSTSGSGLGPDVSREPNAIVRMLVKRDYDPALLRRFKPEEQNALFARASMYDPNINTSDYPTQVATKRSFNAGKGADAVRSINQFVAHVNELADAEATLDNTSFLPGMVNRVENVVGGAVSSKSQTKQGRYNQVASAVANEYENMLRGSSVSGVKERQEVLHDLDMNRSPDDIRGVIDGMLRVMSGRLGELRDQYSKGTGLQENFDVLNPKSKSVLRRFGIASDSGGAPTSDSPPTTPPTAPLRVPQLQKTQTNKATGATRVIYSDDGGATWHP